MLGESLLVLLTTIAFAVATALPLPPQPPPLPPLAPQPLLPLALSLSSSTTATASSCCCSSTAATSSRVEIVGRDAEESECIQILFGRQISEQMKVLRHTRPLKTIWLVPVYSLSVEISPCHLNSPRLSILHGLNRAALLENGRTRYMDKAVVHRNQGQHW